MNALVPASILAASGAAILARGMLHPRDALFGPILWRTTDPGVALTFDDGPWPGSTEPILDALAQAGARAAFFVIGRNALRWPRLVERIHDEGHLVANHTLDHHRWGTLRHSRYWSLQLDGASDAVASILSRRPALLRPPMGYRTPFLMRTARERSLRVVTWTRRAFDGVPASLEAIVARATAARPGDILALHDGAEPSLHRKPAPTADALPEILRRLSGRGLAFPRLDDALALPAYL